MAATRDGIDALLRDRGLRRTTPDLTAESLLRGAHASAVLEGSGADPRGGALRAAPDAMALAAVLRVSTELLGLVPVLARSPLQAFARMHTLAGKGEVADDDARPAPRRRVGGPARRAWPAAARAHHRARARGRRGRPRRAGHRRAVRLAQRHRRPRGRAAGARGPRRRPHVARRPGGRPPRAAPRVRVEPARLPEGGPAGVHAWLLYAAEAYAAGAEASPLARLTRRGGSRPVHASGTPSHDRECRR